MRARILIAVLLTAAGFWGVLAWNAHLVAQGDARGAQRVRTEWEAAEAKRQAAGKEALLQAERRARADEQNKQIETERVAREQAQREGTLRAAVARTDARNRSLLDTIADLNARAPASVPGTTPHADTTASFTAARTGRELLGACSSRYAAVAADADGLAIQVTGLQDFIASTSATSAIKTSSPNGF